MSAAANEIGIVNGLPGVASGVDGFDHQMSWGGVSELKTQTGDSAFPSRDAIKGNHGSSFANGSVGCGSFRIGRKSWRKIGAIFGGEFRLLLCGPFDVAICAIQTGRPPIDAKPWSFFGIEGEWWRADV